MQNAEFLVRFPRPFLVTHLSGYVVTDYGQLLAFGHILRLLGRRLPFLSLSARLHSER